MTDGTCHICGNATAAGDTGLCRDCAALHGQLNEVASHSTAPVGVVTLETELTGLPNRTFVTDADVFPGWFRIGVLEQLPPRPPPDPSEPGMQMQMVTDAELGIVVPKDLRVTVDGVEHRGFPFGGGGGRHRMHHTFRFLGDPPAEAERFSFSGGRNDSPGIDAAAIEATSTPIRDVDVTVNATVEHPDAVCNRCGHPVGRDGLFCDDCRDSVDTACAEWEASGPFPTGVVPLGLHAGIVLGGDVTFLSIHVYERA